MRYLGAALMGMMTAGAASAQIIPLGAPIIPPPKVQAAPSPSSKLDQSGRIHAQRPIGSNYSPYSIQPLGSVTAAAPSGVAPDRTVSSGVVADAALPESEPKKPAKAADQHPSDLQRLAPKAAERSDMSKASAPAAAEAPVADAPLPKR